MANLNAAKPSTRPDPARTKAAQLQRLRQALELPRDTRCSWCRTAQALPGQWYCQPCKGIKDRRRRVLARRVCGGLVPLADLPPKVKLSALFFKRPLAWGSKSYGCSALGKLRWRQLSEDLADREIPHSEFFSHLASHSWHRCRGVPRSRECPICTQTWRTTG